VFHLDVAYFFTLMLQVFHLDVAYVLQWLHTCFPRVLDACCKCFNCFRRMLQMFSLNIVKVDTVLYMLQWTLFTVTAYYSCLSLHACGCGGDASGRRGKPCGRRSRQTRSGHRTRSGAGPHEACGADFPTLGPVRTLAF
jgi:hypothetical protein